MRSEAAEKRCQWHDQVDSRRRTNNGDCNLFALMGEGVKKFINLLVLHIVVERGIAGDRERD